MAHQTAASDLPLNEQFARAIAFFNQTADGWPTLGHLANLTLPLSKTSTIQQAAASIPRSDAAETCIRVLNELSANVSTARILSSNEQLDEIATHSLKYVLLPFLSAGAYAACQGEPDHRLQNLTAASHHLTAFFTSVDNLSLLTPQDRDRVLGDSSEQQTTGREPTREEKIQRYKAEKQSEKRLQILLENAQNQGGSMTAEGSTDFEEEAVRDVMLIVLQSAVRRALDMHAVLQKECAILQWGERQRARGIDPRERAERARPRGPMESVVPGMPANFRIVNDREKERAGVFRPSHSLPTYTVEEWGEFELERMARAEREKQEGGVSAKKADEDSDDEETAHKDTLEKRRWDDWKDEHNRGSGNTIR